MIEPRRFSRFRIGAFALIESAAVLCGGRAWYRWRYLRRERLGVREVTLECAGLPDDLDGVVIAHCTDIHAGPFLGSGDLAGLAELLEERLPDFVCWTGDYVTHSIENARPVLAELRRCRGARATLAVFGNHDYKHRREWEFVQALEPEGWTFLRNGSFIAQVGASRIAFSGIEDPEEGKVVDVEAALSGTEDSDLVIALSHGPRGAPAFATHGVRAVLSGHTHGGQIDAPFLRGLGPAHPGLRVELGATTALVSRGLGVVGVPLRVGAPAEVVFLTLRNSDRAARPQDSADADQAFANAAATA